MDLTVLIIDVEISDQYGTSEQHVVGVFDDAAALGEAKKRAEQKYRTRRTNFTETAVQVNQSLL